MVAWVVPRVDWRERGDGLRAAGECWLRLRVWSGGRRQRTMDGWGVHGGCAVRWRGVAAAVMAAAVTLCWVKSREAAAQVGSGARAR